MTQQTFDFASEMPYERDISARKHQGNPESAAAFEAHEGDRKQDRKAVLAILRKRPATAKEIAGIIRKPLNAISGRCSELKAEGLIETTENVRNGSRELRLVRGTVSTESSGIAGVHVRRIG